MRILIFENEQKMSSYLHKGLTEASFNVDLANDGRHGLAMSNVAKINDVLNPHWARIAARQRFSFRR
jgi:DNA-binding response OmpR family regulator